MDNSYSLIFKIYSQQYFEQKTNFILERIVLNIKCELSVRRNKTELDISYELPAWREITG